MRKHWRLWDVYHNFFHLFLHLTNDWTDDIDSPDEYQQFYEKLVKAAENDRHHNGHMQSGENF